MSLERCERCSNQIDTDVDTDCYVEVGNMRRLHQTIVLCEPCRERHYEEVEREKSLEPCRTEAVG